MRFGNVTRTALALLLAVAMASSSCGGDSDDAATSEGATTRTQSAPLTKSQYIAEADAICERTNRTAKRLNEEVQSIARAEEDDKKALVKFAPVFEEGLDNNAKGIEQVAQLEPPSSEERRVQRFIDNRREENRLVQRLADAASEGDVDTFQTLIDQQQRIRDKSKKLAQEIGYKECGSGKNEAD